MKERINLWYLANNAIESSRNVNGGMFYGKACLYSINGWKFVRSYNTIVCCVTPSGEYRKLWAGWSSTTCQHVRKLLGVSFRMHDTVHEMPELYEVLA